MTYLVTRAVGLAGFEEAAGNWANPWGSFTLIVEGLYLARYFSVATGVAVALEYYSHIGKGQGGCREDNQYYGTGAGI